MSHSKPLRPFLLFAIFCVCFALPMGTPQAGEAKILASYPMQFMRGNKQVVDLQVEVAKTPEQKRYGLMFRETLAEKAGMLFIYHPARKVEMWMKNTLIPLDMVFLDSARRIVHIHRNAVPLSLDTIDGGQNIWAALELNGGAAQAFGLQTGDVLHIPDHALKDEK